MEENNILKSMLDTTHVLIAYMDQNFDFIRVNRAYAEADDKSISFFPGKNHFELYPNEDNEKIFQKVVDSGEPYFIKAKPFEYEHSPERGTSFWDWSLIPTKDSKGKVSGVVLTLRDVTDREIARRKLKESIKRTNFYKDLLAHDIRNILFVINSSAELMDMGLEKPIQVGDIRESIERIKKQVDNGASLISNVQKLSEAEKEIRETRQVEIKPLLNEVISQIKNQFEQRDITIETQLPTTSLKVKGGPLLNDAFENILLNGIQHNDKEDKKLWIEGSQYREGMVDYIQIEFKDNGRGIPDKNKQNVFMRGVKTQDSNGMGIGLSLVKEIINGYNGRVWVENRVKEDFTQGSNFIVLLKEC